MELERMDHRLGYEKGDHNLKFEKIEMVDNDDIEYVKVEKIDADFETMNDDIEYEKVEKPEMLDDEDYGYDLRNEDKDNDEDEEDEDEDEEDEDEDEDNDEDEEDEDEDEYEVNDMEYEKEDVKYSTPSSPKPSRDMEIKGVVKDIVLPFLPAKALAKFRTVSKEWDRWIKNPFLVHQQSYYFKGLSGFFCQYAGDHTFVSLENTAYGVPSPGLSFLPEQVKVLSSCNGLLLCHGLDALDPYYVCNPATREWTGLPKPELYHDTNSVAVLAFEPCPFNMDAAYQLLCLVPMQDHVYIELYSSKTRSWKISEAMLVEMKNSTITSNCFYMKGIAYLETSDRKVIAFDLSSEVYEIISLHDRTPRGGVLTQIKGELSYIGIFHSFNNGVNSKKNGYSIRIFTGMNLSIERQLDVAFGPELDTLPSYRVLPCLDGENGMVLVGNVIYSYRMRNQSLEMVTSVANVAEVLAKYLPYVNSLVQVAKPF